MHVFRSALSSALFLAVSPFAAAAGVQHNAGVQSSINYRALQIQAANSASGGAQPAELYANPQRAYPASCLNAPLPLGLYNNDPNKVSTTISLRGDPLSSDVNENNYTETDTVTVFRVACANNESAVLIEIDRPSNASTMYYPVFPGMSIGSNNYVPRMASDPNTFYSNVYAFDPLLTSDVVVFENVFGGTPVNYNQALAVFVDNLQSGSNADLVEFDIPAYNAAQYASTSQPLPISGYQSGNYYDPNHSGEGIQIEVGETASTGTRVITVAWYTFDASGIPYWLYGTGTFSTGANTAAVTMAYASNGGFAGDFGKATVAQWGTLNVNFPDCNTMNFSYASAAGLPSGVPSGSGSKSWTRLTTLNGLTCQ